MNVVVDPNKLFEKCMKQTSKKVIKGRDILTYCQSSFAFYCNHFVDDSKKDLPRKDILSLAKKGVLHEDEIMYEEKHAILRKLGVEHEDEISEEYRELLPTNFKQIQTPTMKAKFKICLDEMVNKKTRILYDAPLFFLSESILGKPDILEKRKGKSLFGSHHYVIKEIKSAKIIQRHHILQAAFYNLLIGHIQQKIPKYFYVINGEKKETTYCYADYEWSLIETLKLIMEILQQKIKPHPYYNNTPYPWLGYGNKIAIKENGISLIIGIKEKKQEILRQHGFKTINQIASCNISKLASVHKIGNMAKQFQSQAQAVKHNKAIKKIDFIFPKRKTEVFLDFEGEFGGNEIYLIGMLIREDKKIRYISFTRGSDEKKIWRDFLKFIKKQNNYVIYHWHNYEKRHMKRMGQEYKTSKKILDSIFSENNILDLRLIATSAFAFPTYKNDLKSIAKWMGFRWTESDINGANVQGLFDEYLNDPRKNKQFLQMVLDYNKDDCEATMVIKDWLVINR